MRHVLLHEGSPHTEGAGAKWREVKYGLWLTLRLNWLLHLQQHNATVSWLPNPAMMQNPHLNTHHQSMMGGLGITSAGPPVLAQSPPWLYDRIEQGEYDVLELIPGRNPIVPPSPTWQHRTGHTATSDRELEAQTLAAIGAATKPLALLVRDTHDPMHWHGSAGRWLHDAFISHRLRRAGRATGRAELQLPEGVPSGRFLISVHIRAFGLSSWDLPGSYFVSAVEAVFEATPLSCATAAILVIGPASAPATTSLASAFECVHQIARAVKENHEQPKLDRHAADDYGPVDDLSDARRGFVFRDLELLALSDVLIGSNSEFSRLAQSLTAPDTLVLCAPRRPLSDNFGLNHGLPCDETGVPNSIRTRLDALASDQVTSVETPRVPRLLADAWRRRAGGDLGAGPIWGRPRHGLVPFDFTQPVEEARWHNEEAPGTATGGGAHRGAAADGVTKTKQEL